MIKRKSMAWGNGFPCIYIGIGLETYCCQQIDRVRVKIGISRSMGRRRRALRGDTRYLIETIDEQLIPFDLDPYLERIENDLHTWLHNAPTSAQWCGETEEVDFHVAEYLIEQFPNMVIAISQQYKGAN